MNKYIRYFFIAVFLIILGLILWYFKAIIAYILIAVMLSFLGRPIVDGLKKLKILKWHIPGWLAAAVSLICIWAVIVTFFYIFVPLVVDEAKVISKIDFKQVESNLQKPINQFEAFLIKFSGDSDFSLQDYISEKMKSLVKFSNVSGFFGTFTNTISGIFIGIFSISFITFFFLKDSNLFVDGLTTFIPSKHEEKVRKVIYSVKKLLVRYFVGIVFEVILVMTLDTIGLTIVGIEFKDAVVIGLVAGCLNIIPYVGPLVGGILGILIGMSLNLHLDFYSQLLPLVGFMALVFIITQIIDNTVFQPLIYSSSVHAHPLEIFLVILIAGSAFGIIGMILAIPAYTILRVIGREFFAQYEVVKKLTQNLSKE